MLDEDALVCYNRSVVVLWTGGVEQMRALVLCLVLLVGCAAPHHAGHGTKSDGHASSVQMTIDAVDVQAGVKTGLGIAFDDDGKRLTDFDVVHERPLHLIVVHSDLRVFDHVHPTLQPDGTFQIEMAFARPGTYFVYADIKPEGMEAMTVHGSLVVGGSGSAPGAWVVDRLPRVDERTQTDRDLVAALSLGTVPVGDVVLPFAITDRTGAPVDDLEQYLGALGHVVIVSADGKRYVHVHPEKSYTPKFVASFDAPGTYHAWLQVQRGGVVHTFGYVIEVT
jgi:hypothetical protein